MANNYNTKLQSNNIDLQSILNVINALPEESDGVKLPILTNEGTAADLLDIQVVVLLVWMILSLMKQMNNRIC